MKLRQLAIYLSLNQFEPIGIFLASRYTIKIVVHLTTTSRGIWISHIGISKIKEREAD